MTLNRLIFLNKIQKLIPETNLLLDEYLYLKKDTNQSQIEIKISFVDEIIKITAFSEFSDWVEHLMKQIKEKRTQDSNEQISLNTHYVINEVSFIAIMNLKEKYFHVIIKMSLTFYFLILILNSFFIFISSIVYQWYSIGDNTMPENMIFPQASKYFLFQLLNQIISIFFSLISAKIFKLLNYN
jgi:hypothetical protein